MSTYKSDELARWVTFWNVTDGRDKLNKLLQYSCKGFAWAVAGADANLQLKLLSLSQTCADSRKIFRLGKFLNEYLKIKALLNSSADATDIVAHLLTLGTRASYFAYWVFDALFILSKMKIINGDTKRISDKSFLFWFSGIVFNLVLDFHIIRLVVIRERQLEKQETVSRTEELQRLREKRRACYLSIIKNCGDLVTSSNGLRIPHRLIGRGFSDGLVGVGGSISAIIACYQQYPQGTEIRK